MEDDNCWHLGGVARWNSHFLIHTWTFLAIISVASQLFLYLFWISLWLKNRCLQHPCFKNLCKIAQASKNSDSNAQHFPFGFANTFMMISLHALCTPRLPIPFILSWWIGVSLPYLYITTTTLPTQFLPETTEVSLELPCDDLCFFSFPLDLQPFQLFVCNRLLVGTGPQRLRAGIQYRITGLWWWWGEPQVGSRVGSRINLVLAFQGSVAGWWWWWGGERVTSEFSRVSARFE